jgi:hypothetical protein
MINASKLTVKHSIGAGFEIFAHIDKPVDCGTHGLKGNHDQVIVQQVAYAPWIQFEPEEWTSMIEKLFTEMVEAWNEKHGEPTNASA